MRTTLLLAPFLTIPLASEARITTSNNEQNSCVDGIRKSATLSVNFNGEYKSLTETLAAIDINKRDLEKTARKAGLVLILSSYDYGLNSNTSHNDGQPKTKYEYSGSISYLFDNEETAKRFAEKLDEQKYQFSMNVGGKKCN